MSAILDFYTQHSPITHPGAYAHLYNDLPRELPALHQVIQNIYIHVWKVRKYNPEWLKGRTHEYESRSVAKSLSLVMAHNSRPLTEARPKNQKLIIDCRHFAVLLVSMLRSQGVPARVRVGFASYLEQSHLQDHWVCEYWNGDRWVMDDPDLLKHDITPEEFVTGGRAWQMIRKREVPDIQFGFSPHDRGEWAVRYDLPRDLAAMNKFEMLSGDAWGVAEKKDPMVNARDRKLLDEAAAVVGKVDTDFEAMRQFYDANDALRVPDTIHLYNYIDNKNKTVAWDDRPSA
ncbi:MAG: transglutaminase-like domain-containing protein [Chloroflexi bacterium]|nr:transglutaminase-like domain-containing protein [Chloroflexota bacterium]MCC6892950.1 transglutaminase domain-containing protein [Anaerolineae bacterium]